MLFILLWAALHLWIVPRVDDWRVALESRATQALGVTVRIGALHAQPRGLFPALELRDVELLDASGRVGLALPRVVASLSPDSILRFGFDQLYLEAPALDIRRSRAGRITIGGLDLASGPEGDGSAADWFFSQAEFIIQNGSVTWTDEARADEPLTLTGVDVVLRNSRRRHAMRLDATPPAHWGERFSLVGLFRQPLLSRHAGQWRDWDGQVYGHFAQVDLSELRRHADIGVDIRQGQGALRFWVQVQRASVAGATVDAALSAVSARLGDQLDALLLRDVQGRLEGRRLPGGFELQAQGLQFTTGEGARWPGGNLSLAHTEAMSGGASRTELRADRMELAAIGQLASHLPLGQTAHEALHTHAPRGIVHDLVARWNEKDGRLASYEARGRVTGLAISAAEPVALRRLGVPGVHGLDVDFDLTQAGGQANLSMTRGTLTFPGLFDDPTLSLDRLSAEAQWRIAGEQVSVDLRKLRFANADAQGEAQLRWRTADPAKSRARSRFPGVLDLDGQISRADAARTWRYLPSVIPEAARRYVRESVTQAEARDGVFKVRGDLYDFPFAKPDEGIFRIAARFQNATYQFAPKTFLPDGSREWFALNKLSGQAVFEGVGMHIRDVHGAVPAMPGVQIARGEARIDEFHHPVVQVSADARGPLAEFLGTLQRTPLADWTQHQLDQASVSGSGDLRLALQLPIGALEQSRVNGTLALTGADFRLTPDLPAVQRVRGQLQFSESGFALAGAQAHVYGGDVRLDTALRMHGMPGGAEPVFTLKAQGTANAEALREASELGALTQVVKHTRGSAPYTLDLSVRRSVTEVQLQSPLQGMAIELPEPFAKLPEASLPLVMHSRWVRGPAAAASLEHWQFELGSAAQPLARGQWERDVSAARARLLRGSFQLGQAVSAPEPLPAQGVVAQAQWPMIDADAWARALPGLLAGDAAPVAAGSGFSRLPIAEDWLPQRVRLKTGELRVEGRSLHDVDVSATRSGALWQVSGSTREGRGTAEYRPPDEANPYGRVAAKLARLTIAQSAVGEVEQLLENQPANLPALDVEVEQFELRGKSLGRLEVQARNQLGDSGANEWRLSRLALSVPEASLLAEGRWAARAGSRRRTQLDLNLQINDAGLLLARLGLPGAVRRGSGKLAGQVGWTGSPFSLDYPSLSGQLHLDVESGQFLKADPGAAKLLGVLSLQSLPRRLVLDFRDLFTEGFPFDFVRGDVDIAQGMASTRNLQMKGINAVVLMEGRADLKEETQDLHVVVVPEINAGTASLVATVINPVIGVGSMLAQLFLRQPLIQATTQEFRVDGSWADPRVQRIPRRLAAEPGEAASSVSTSTITTTSATSATSANRP